MDSAIRRLIGAHHDAFAVELLGVNAAGVSADKIEALLASGTVDVGKLGGFMIPGMANECDPFLFARMVARVMANADPALRDEMRQWTLAQWLPHVDNAISAAHVQGGLHLGGVISIPTPATTLELAAARSAKERAGSYARGLGNAIGAELDAALAESWSGEFITEEIQPGVRAETIQRIRDHIAEGPAQDPRAVARALARETKRWSHDWLRIAETELQGAYNDGALTEAVEAYGDEAQVARVPESGACDSCREHFLDGEGKPIVCAVADLLANGTNVGRRRADWRATLWPMHPRCVCDTLIVPPGMYVTESGRLRKRRGMEDE